MSERFKKGDIVTYSDGRTKTINKPFRYEKYFDENYYNSIYDLKIIKIERYYKFLCFYRLKTIYIENNNEFIEILDSIVSYNGLYDPLSNLKLDIENDKFDEDNPSVYSKEVYSNYDYKFKPKHEYFDDQQFEIFWMILVLKFGDYGTSPRCGWLLVENKKEIIKFIDDITKTERESLEEEIWD